MTLFSRPRDDNDTFNVSRMKQLTAGLVMRITQYTTRLVMGMAPLAAVLVMLPSPFALIAMLSVLLLIAVPFSHPSL